MADGSGIGILRDYFSSGTPAAAAVLVLCFLIISGFTAELYAGALSEANMSAVKKSANSGSRKAIKAEKMLENERKYLGSGLFLCLFPGSLLLSQAAPLLLLADILRGLDQGEVARSH